jgi:hypothetical protein
LRAMLPTSALAMVEAKRNPAYVSGWNRKDHLGAASDWGPAEPAHIVARPVTCAPPPAKALLPVVREPIAAGRHALSHRRWDSGRHQSAHRSALLRRGLLSPRANRQRACSRSASLWISLFRRRQKLALDHRRASKWPDGHPGPFDSQACRHALRGLLMLAELRRIERARSSESRRQTLSRCTFGTVSASTRADLGPGVSPGPGSV